jgi:hypothetical protein
MDGFRQKEKAAMNRRTPKRRRTHKVLEEQ